VALLWATVAVAQTDTDGLFARAGQDYDAARFADAAARYDSLTQMGYANAELYFNLGNAHFRAGNVGEAIWAYRVSQQLAPRDPDIDANLTVARLAARDRIETIPPGFWKQLWLTLGSLLSLREGAWLVTILWSALWLFIAGWLFYPSLRRWTAAGVRMTATAWVIAAIIFAARYLEITGTHGAVLIAAEAEAKSGPGREFDPVFTGHAGLECTVRGNQNGYVLLELANGRVGWVPETDIMLLPS
jgi:tetratricopeptide (TPR) repeat protein